MATSLQLALVPLLFLFAHVEARNLVGGSTSSSPRNLPPIEKPGADRPLYIANVFRAREHTSAGERNESDLKASTSGGLNYLGRGQAGPSQNRARARGRLIAWPALAGGRAGEVKYMGGPMMTKPMYIHTILYGVWPEDAGESALRNFVESLSSSEVDDVGPTVHKWWNIALAYTQKDGQAVTPEVRWGQVVRVDRGYKKELGDGFGKTKNEIGPIVEDAINSGSLPKDFDAVYLVLTAKDIVVGDNVNGFCGFSGYCGWHGTVKMDRKLIQYGFVGDPTEQCNFQCGHNNQMEKTANGYYSMDSMMSTIAHEIVEAATDPVLGEGWISIDENGEVGWENADLCNAQFTDSEHRTVLTDRRKTYGYNVHGVNKSKFLIQTNVDISKQECVLQAEAP